MTTIEKDPVRFPEANKLRAWFDDGDFAYVHVQSVTAGPVGGGKITEARKTLQRAKMEDLNPVFSAGGNGSGATATFVTGQVASFLPTKGDLYYPGVPEFRKKVIQQAPGIWYSEGSGRELTDDKVVWRHIVRMRITDSSSSEWVGRYNEIEIEQLLFGRPAKELHLLKEEYQVMYENILDAVKFRQLLINFQVKERIW
ncbi:Replication factor-a protein 1 Rpa1 [Gracilaria domingensis]|nr:Replication factor-a protein 1 Rpa1 [Gracilaria domingensis]